MATERYCTDGDFRLAIFPARQGRLFLFLPKLRKAAGECLAVLRDFLHVVVLSSANSYFFV
jgi:hypothetical protein